MFISLRVAKRSMSVRLNENVHVCLRAALAASGEASWRRPLARLARSRGREM